MLGFDSCCLVVSVKSGEEYGDAVGVGVAVCSSVGVKTAVVVGKGVEVGVGLAGVVVGDCVLLAWVTMTNESWVVC